MIQEKIIILNAPTQDPYDTLNEYVIKKLHQKRQKKTQASINEGSEISLDERKQWGDDFISAVVDPQDIGEWTVETLKSTPQSAVKRHLVKWNEKAQKSGEYYACNVSFIEKSNKFPPELKAYRQFSNRPERPDYIPHIFRISRFPKPADAPYKNRIVMQDLPPIAQFNYNEADAKNLAGVMADLNSLENIQAEQFSFEVDFVLSELNRIKTADKDRAVFSDQQWANIERKMAAFAEWLLLQKPVFRPCHVDLHVNNLFYVKTDETSSQQLKIIDWEKFSVRPIGTDLHHFLAETLRTGYTDKFYFRILEKYAALVRPSGVTTEDLELAAYFAVLKRTSVSLRNLSKNANIHAPKRRIIIKCVNHIYGYTLPEHPANQNLAGD